MARSSSAPMTPPPPTTSQHPINQRHLPYNDQSAICAKLVTANRGRREAVILKLNRPATIGRHPQCDYVISGTQAGHVSAVHCILSAVRSQNGGVIVSCQDYSRNGILLNEHRISKSVVILMHGDKLQLPNSATFTCHHIWKDRLDKADLFDPTPPQHRTMSIGKYLVTSQKLGSGSFATVHLALDTSRTTRRQVACKTIRKKKGCDMRQVFKEISILNGLQHPNINRIYDTEEDDQFMFIFLQLCTGGDLFTYITAYAEKESHLCEAEAKFIMYQLLVGLHHLHSRMISHRDLQPENILLYAPGPYPRIVIADFGLARPRAYQATLNVCGTVSYLPPEGILALDQEHLKYTGMPSDCWSAGVVLFIMLAGAHPFDNYPLSDSSSASDWLSHMKASHYSQASQNYQLNEARLKAKIVDGAVQFDSHPWNRLPDAKQLVASLLVHDYTQRATVEDALRSQWIHCELDELNITYRNQVLSH
ncbi:kinase-like protein [Mycena alexandri]|uniref:Kinase-like protein n=1 Tax=Mycena alexandri TaxID=1745969 RepID=A0AAD6T9P1_9AGAR|nr:kinase-like protein [Mycena alexandri]